MTLGRRLARLGFWNRLALVLGVAVTIIYPTWSAIAENMRLASALDSGFEICLDARRTAVDAFDVCWEIWKANRSPAVSVDAWGIYVTITALGCLTIYAILWGVVSLTKWVWRGRAAKNTDTA